MHAWKLNCCGYRPVEKEAAILCYRANVLYTRPLVLSSDASVSGNCFSPVSQLAPRQGYPPWNIVLTRSSQESWLRLAQKMTMTKGNPLSVQYLICHQVLSFLLRLSCQLKVLPPKPHESTCGSLEDALAIPYTWRKHTIYRAFLLPLTYIGYY